VADQPVAERHDVLDREPYPPAVIDRDGRHRAVLEAAVDEHERGAGRGQLHQQLAVESGRGGDEPVHLPPAHCLEIDALALRIVVGVDHQRRVTGLVEAILDPPQNRREQRVRDVRDHNSNRVRPARLEPSGDPVGAVSELVRRREHPLGRLLVYERSCLLVERA
jgi:hypothetical protein